MRIAEAVDALDDPYLEAVVVGRSLCLHQPLTQALALVPNAAECSDAGALPPRDELAANGFLVETVARDGGPSQQGTALGLIERRADRLGDYQVCGGAVISLGCDCLWLRPRLGVALAPLAVKVGEQGVRGQVDVAIRKGGADTVSFEIDGQVIRDGVPRAEARRLALNIILVEGLRHRGVGAILHGAAVSRGDGCAILVGVTGVGKSTLALGLAARGWRHLADDLVALGHRGDTVHPFPVSASVKAGSWAIVAEEFPELMDGAVLTFGSRAVRYLDVHAKGSLPDRSVAPDLLVVAEREAGRPEPLVDRLSPEAAFAALIETGSEAVGDPPSMAALADLVNQTPAIRFSFGDVVQADIVLSNLLAAGAGDV